MGWWPFTGNANDLSGNTNNGLVNGAILTTDRFGNLNNAYSFDGINDYILVNNNTSLCPIVYSISAWVKSNGYYINGQDDANYIVGKGTDFNVGHYSLHYKSISLKARASIGIGSSGLYVASNSNINLNNWIYLANTWDGNNLRIYINGILENSIYSPNNVQGVSSENLYFGTMAGNSTWPYWLNGKIDDIGIWNRALTQQEITNLYNASLSTEDFAINTIDIYPNPTTSLLNFKSAIQVEKILIYNMLGQLVQQEKVNALEGTINIEKLAQGTYIVKVNDLDKGYTIIKN
ncbi:LamG-like jellyroll fold domain-containing protein [Flavobacterium sp.]|uniref:LamG-like jellyroll fold domain-containing protein n=1 Tax=Flavobacterium sp. TaxID=239 RepID=UPI003341CB18